MKNTQNFSRVTARIRYHEDSVSDEISQPDVNERDSEDFKVKAIQKSDVYVKESQSGYLSSLYYLVLWKTILRRKILESLL